MKQVKMLLVCMLLILPTAMFGQTLGDANSDSTVDIIDALVTAQFYVGLPVTIDEIAADVNCDADINVSDVVYLINYLFKGGPEPCSE